MTDKTIFVGGPLHGKPAIYGNAPVEMPVAFEGHIYKLRKVAKLDSTSDPDFLEGKAWWVFVEDSVEAETALALLAEAGIAPHDVEKVLNGWQP